MNRASNHILREVLKALGLAAVIALAGGVLAVSLVTVLWWDDVDGVPWRHLVVLWVTYLTFFLAVPRLSPEVRAWLAGLPRARRVSLWLFVTIGLLFAVSQLRLEARLDWAWGGLRWGGIDVTVWGEPWCGWWIGAETFERFETTWMPSLSVGDRFGNQLFDVSIPLWIVGVAVLWPWWMPRLRWLLGGRVQRGRPRASWMLPVALGGLLTSGMLFWLSLQSLSFPYAMSCYTQMNRGELHWHHDTQNAVWPSPTTWSWDGYAGERMHWRPHAQWGPRVYELAVPMWIPTLAFLILLTLSVIPRHRHRRRWEGGLCLHCGYDLRGLGERCTECGTTIEPERLAAMARDDAATS